MKLDEWHKAVLKRDGHHCRSCHRSFNYPAYFNEAGKNVMLCGHHIKSQKAYPALRLDISNGVTLCLDCHQKVHNGQISNNFKNAE